MSLEFGWVEFDDLREYVKAHLQKSPNESLKPHWDTILTPALKSAYWTIVNAFLTRGYTKEQIDQWDRGEEFQKDIAAWFALKRLAFIHPDMVSQQHLTELDRRTELVGEHGYMKTDTPAVILTINGVPVDQQGTFGQVHTGEMDTSDDLFIMDPSDPRLGQPTRW